MRDFGRLESHAVVKAGNLVMLLTDMGTTHRSRLDMRGAGQEETLSLLLVKDVWCTRGSQLLGYK